MVRSFVKHMVRGTMLDDAPWEWSGAWTKGMPEFFSEVQGAYPGSDVYGNVYDTLDTTPTAWHITEPVDPCEYQNEWLGSVINIY